MLQLFTTMEIQNLGLPPPFLGTSRFGQSTSTMIWSFSEPAILPPNQMVISQVSNGVNMYLFVISTLL